MKRTGITRYLTLSLAALMSINLVACGSAKTTDTESTKAEAASQQEDIESAINKVVGNGQEGGADKEETVYVFTDANGNTKNITVSNWLKNVKGNSTIKDASTLTDIKNVEGDEKYTANGDNLTWKADGNDIYYQGKTNKKPPVSQEITYYLDGKAVDPDDLAGKSGHVKIHIDYTNTEKYNDVYVPFTAVTGLALNNDNVKNVKVDHGSVVSEGKHTVVVGMAFPGLQDSLQSIKDDTKDMLDQVSANQKAKDKVNDLNIPSSVEIEMDAKDFQLSTALTMVFSNLLTDDNTGISSNEVDKDHDDALDEMDDKVNELTDDGDKLADGATELSDGIKTANDNMPTMKSGTKQLADGVKEYTDGVTQLDNGVSTLKSGTSKLAANSGSLKSGAKQLDSGISSLKSGADKLASNSSTLVNGANQLDAGVQKFMAYANAINSDGGKSLKNQVGTQARSGLLNSADYKTQKKQMLGKVNGISTQFDDSKAFINKYFNVAYKAATDPASMSSSERSSYNAVKNNDQFKQLVSSIQGSAPQVTAAVTNALADNESDIKKAVADSVSSLEDPGSNEYQQMESAIESALSDETAIGQEIKTQVTAALTSDKSQKAITDAVTQAVTEDKLTQAVTSAVSEAENQKKISDDATAAVTSSLSATENQKKISDGATAAVTGAMGTAENQKKISDDATTAVTNAMGAAENQQAVSNGVTTAVENTMKSAESQQAISDGAESAVSSALNNSDSQQKIQSDVQNSVAPKIAAAKSAIEKSVNEDQVKFDVASELSSEENQAAMQTLNDQIDGLEGVSDEEKAALKQSIAAAVNQAAVAGGDAAVTSVKNQIENSSEINSSVTDLVKTAATAAAGTAAKIAGNAAAESAAGNAATIAGNAAARSAAESAAKIAGNAAATSAAGNAATIAGNAAATSAAGNAATIAGNAAAASAAKDAASIAGTAAGKEAANLSATAAANVAANIAVQTALANGLAPKVAEAVAQSTGTTIATLAANAASEKVATIAGAAAAMTVGQSTMNQTIDTIKATMNKQLGNMDLSTTIDEMSGKIAYNVGSGVVDQLLAKVMGSSTTSGLTQLSSGTHQLASGIKTYTDGVGQVASGANQLKSGSSQLASGISTYTNGVDQLDSGVSTLKNGTSKLTANNGTLVSGTQTLSEGAQTLADGMAKLLSGSVELKDGVVKFNDEGIKKLADLYNTDVKSLDNKVQELKDAAKSYKTFSGAASDEDSTVKFIYKMDSIETDDKND